MLIDKLKRINPSAVFPEAPEHKLNGAVTFFIDEEGSDFLSKMDGKTYDAVLPSRLPYDNIFLQLKKEGVWVVTSENRIYVSFFLLRYEKRNRFRFVIQEDSPVLYFSAEISEDNSLSDFTTYKDERYSAAFDNMLMLNLPVAIVMEFLNIMSCKNIRAKKIGANKKRKSTKKPLFSYYILQIVSKVGGVTEAKNIWSNRVHMCRGHIKTYTAEKPLFGKYVGNVWCPPHARGNKENGVIQKDYKIS